MLLKYGFPLDFPNDKRKFLKNAEDNHTSALEFPADIDYYIDTELKFGALSGPYDAPPYGNASHISPIMSRPKPDSEKRRVIIDVSWPKEASVNHFTNGNMYLGTAFRLLYPTVDTITEHLRKVGTDAKIYKIDLSRAFRQLPVDPHDYDLLCLRWKGAYFSDHFTPFGHVGGSLSCCRLTSFFRYLARRNGYVTYCYVDDVIGIGVNPEATKGFHFMKNLLEELNFPISNSKLVTPSQQATCLGIIINVKKQTVSIPEGKQEEILKKCQEISKQKFVTKRSFQSLLGSLMFVHKCVKSSRTFTNRLLECLRHTESARDAILATYMQNLWLITSIHDIRLTVSHIAGKQNVVADLLSRWDNLPKNYQDLEKMVPNFEWVHITQEMFHINHDI